ncbi:hypothetical protein EK21DRAFT_85582 [Setomelanomma holmii]|uniref:Uncharacterized protein n=1 Tax=Setomelanomma holmii TaxID=210430 RepID=A0A9P4HID9_9PLEO|nr:hypothetical protein EK21DRAFT_85582 [Setomelanomma holmii]
MPRATCHATHPLLGLFPQLFDTLIDHSTATRVRSRRLRIILTTRSDSKRPNPKRMWKNELATEDALHEAQISLERIERSIQHIEYMCTSKVNEEALEQGICPQNMKYKSPVGVE